MHPLHLETLNEVSSLKIKRTCSDWIFFIDGSWNCVWNGLVSNFPRLVESSRSLLLLVVIVPRLDMDYYLFCVSNRSLGNIHLFFFIILKYFTSNLWNIINVIPQERRAEDKIVQRPSYYGTYSRYCHLSICLSACTKLLFLKNSVPL